MADEQKIVVEVPRDRSYSPIPNPQSSMPNKLEEFRKGWINAIALPDNFPDLAFDLTNCVTIPALLTSCWSTIPFPEFIRLGVFAVLVIASACLLYLRQLVPEVKDLLLLRAGLIAVGVLMGL